MPMRCGLYWTSIVGSMSEPMWEGHQGPPLGIHTDTQILRYCVLTTGPSSWQCWEERWRKGSERAGEVTQLFSSQTAHWNCTLPVPHLCRTCYALENSLLSPPPLSVSPRVQISPIFLDAAVGLVPGQGEMRPPSITSSRSSPHPLSHSIKNWPHLLASL